MQKTLALFFLLIPLALPCRSADVIFGRRLYAERGHSFQQIWTLDSRTKKIAQLTTSERRHDQPACSREGKRIWFLSGAFGEIDDTELWWFDSRAHTETLATRFRGGLLNLLGGTETRAFFIAIEGNNMGLYRWDGRLTKISSIKNSPDAAALSPDAGKLAVETGAANSVILMDAGGAQTRKVNECDAPVWSADARKLACSEDGVIRILDATTGVETAHLQFARPTEPTVADFSPDGKRLLAGTVGENNTSSSPQSDYWLVEIATNKLERVGPGQSAIFAAGGILLVTPRELAPVGKGHDWISQILLVDPATHAQTPVAAGTASNVEPRRCRE